MTDLHLTEKFRQQSLKKSPKYFQTFNKIKKAADMEHSNTENVGSNPVRIVSCSLWLGLVTVKSWDEEGQT
jgi:hypothetical protein